jgi:hypothetical protein
VRLSSEYHCSVSPTPGKSQARKIILIKDTIKRSIFFNTINNLSKYKNIKKVIDNGITKEIAIHDFLSFLKSKRPSIYGKKNTLRCKYFIIRILKDN